MDFMHYINMVPDWVACFWCFVMGYAIRSLISDVREIASRLKSARVPVGEIVIRRLTPAAPFQETDANEPDKLQDGKDNPRKPLCKGDENAKRSKKLHARHYTISPCEADALKRELNGSKRQHSEPFMRTVLKLIENARKETTCQVASLSLRSRATATSSIRLAMEGALSMPSRAHAKRQNQPRTNPYPLTTNRSPHDTPFKTV